MQNGRPYDKFRLVFLFTGILVAACSTLPTMLLPTPSPTRRATPLLTQTLPIPSQSPKEAALALLCVSTIYDQRNPMLGRVVRFRTPVAIDPHGNSSILKAIANYATRSNGLVTFEIVDSDPAIGITVMSGDAVDRYGEPGCGNVTSQPAASSGHRFAPDSTGALAQRAYLHLGTSGCDDTRTGRTSSSVAEHELAHALGVGNHFTGFTGDEGLSDELNAVIILLYSTAPGTDMSTVCPPR